MKRISRKLIIRKNLISVVAVLSLLIMSGVQTATAVNFTVNSTADTVDVVPGDGLCADSLGDCTLRAAIMETNALPSVDGINLPAGTYMIGIAGTGEDAATTGDLDIADDVTVNGAGNATTFIDGASLDRVLEIRPGATVIITAVTIQNGDPAANAGGILNRATLTLNKSVVTENTGLDFGGGISSNGITSALTLVDSTVSHNDTTGSNLSGGGGGIFTEGTTTISGSTINDNTTLGRGGAIYNADPTLTITNSTISNNTALNGGGIFNRFGTVGVTHGTITLNTATDNGGGVWNFGGTMNLANTIISSNTAATASDDCAGTMASLGYNIAGDASCALAGTGDQNSTDPLLGPLTNNSGPTKTHALLTFSPAIDAVPIVSCPVSTDQRGVPRPMGPACDVGAFERVVPDACHSMIFDNIIVGTAGNNTLNGTNGRDLIFGLGGHDTLNASNGNDCLVGGDGRDRLNASNGDDFLDGGDGDDTLNASNGDDTLNGGAGEDVLNGSNGIDLMDGGTENDRLSGSNGNDVMEGGAGDDRLSGGNGNDTLNGGADTDNLNGGLGTDTCTGETEISCEI